MKQALWLWPGAPRGLLNITDRWLPERVKGASRRWWELEMSLEEWTRDARQPRGKASRRKSTCRCAEGSAIVPSAHREVLGAAGLRPTQGHLRLIHMKEDSPGRKERPEREDTHFNVLLKSISAIHEFL